MSYKRFIAVGALLATVVVGSLLWTPPTASQQVFPTQQNTPVQVQPPGNSLTLQTFVSGTSTNPASANTITLAAQAGKTFYISGIEITGAGATGASIIQCTLAFGGTTAATYQIVIPAGATTSITPLVLSFAQPMVAQAPGTNCVLTVPSFGAGNTNASANIHGWVQ